MVARSERDIRPFFTIILRTCRRPAGLERAVKSVRAQHYGNWEILILADEVGQHKGGNILWANQQFDRHKEKIDGRYVLALDDDGEFKYRDFLSRVYARILEADYPECVLVRSLSPNKQFNYVKLPAEPVWRVDWEAGQRPAFWIGHGYNWVVREDIFKSFAKAYSRNNGGDWHFMTAMINGGVDFCKCEAIGAMTMGRGYGIKFEGCQGTWLAEMIKKLGMVNCNGLRLFGASA